MDKKKFGITLKNFHHVNRVWSKLIQKVHESKISLAADHSIDKLRKNFLSHQKLQASTLGTANLSWNFLLIDKNIFEIRCRIF